MRQIQTKKLQTIRLQSVEELYSFSVSRIRYGIIIFILDTEFLLRSQDMLFDFLNPEQKMRSLRYKTEMDKQNYIATHGCVNILFSKIEQCSISSLQNWVTKNKKPYIQNNHGLTYNISHTKGCAVVALGPGEIGIDIERIMDEFAYEKIWNRYFQSEYGCAFAKKMTQRKFYTFWTIKEACLKYWGLGISSILEVRILNYMGDWALTEHIAFGKCEVRILHMEEGFVISLCSNEEKERLQDV